MRSHVVVLLAAVILVPGGAKLSAQGLDAAAERIEAMRRFNDWMGEWEGTGWSTRGGGERTTFTIRESVRPKLGGAVLLVEGRGTASGVAGAEEMVHEALAVLSYDVASNAYRWRAYTRDGSEVDTELEFTDDGMEWAFRVGETDTRVRFTIRIDASRWYEVGDVSLDDGRTWHRFLEQTLTRQGPS